MRSKIIGRQEEQRVLQKALCSKKAEFITIYGRRRVGKTYLVEQFFAKHNGFFLHVTGKYKGKMKEHFSIFASALSATFLQGTGINIQPPKSWMDALELLTNNINKFIGKEKVVLFFDELPWLATKKSGFLSALDYYWNTVWSKNNKIILIVCGSAASWMIKNIIHNKGGLHNRITLEIPLFPFTLKESQEFLEYLGYKLNHQQILELYMAMGGVPHYLEKIQKGLSAAQNISRLCFVRGGFLYSEFDKLFGSLFDHSAAYSELVKIIASKKEGILRSELDRKVKLSKSGGTLTERLDALERAGFIRGFTPIGHIQKGLCYKVIDEYCLFYLHWIKPISKQIKNESNNSFWEMKINTPAWKSWVGYAFESVCMKHLNQIKKALYIPPDSLAGSWKYIPKKLTEDKGAQIDLLFDRSDGVISIVEIKYSDKPFLIDKNYAENLQNKINAYLKHGRIKKHIILSMVTANGIQKSIYSEKMIIGVVMLDDLFAY
jgi:AAA+ ATPase superfamily predicted ATPase